MKQKPVHLTNEVPENCANKRLDQILAELFPQYSRSRLQQWIKTQQVTIDGKYLKPRDKVQPGQKIIVDATLEEQGDWEAQPINLDVIYEDDAIIVINKPVGLVVHPAAGHPDKTLVNALLHHDPELKNIPRAGIIHRLDKKTSGLLVIAKTLEVHTKLVQELQQRQIKREYEAIVNGVMTAGGTIDAPIGRHPRDRKRMAVVASGKPSVTHYRVIKRFAKHTHIKVMLETGRTHQIRVHMAHIHHHIVGDPVYGGRYNSPLADFKRQALHARRLGLTHPVSGEYMEWEAPLPNDMQELLRYLTNKTL